MRDSKFELRDCMLKPRGECCSVVGLAYVIPVVRVDRGSNAIPVHPITAGSVKLPDWLIKEG